MMARTHVMMGAATWPAVALVVDEINTVPKLVAGMLVSGGAALWPDLDHRNGTAAKTWGPITKGLGYVTERVSGGHRQGTHTILAALLAGGGMFVVLQASVWLAVPVLALLVGLLLVAWEELIPGRITLRRRRYAGPPPPEWPEDQRRRVRVRSSMQWERLWPLNLAASVMGAWLLVVSGVAGGSWLPAAVMVGWLAHILGDAVTTGGVRPFMPFTDARVRLTRLRTNGKVLGFRWEVGAQWAFGVVAVGLLMFGIR